MIEMSNTIWNEWFYTDRFHGKPYPFIDNYCKSKRKAKEEEEKEV